MSNGQGKGGGRKSSITSEKAAILLLALENGLNVKESLIQAGFSQDAYDRKLLKDEKFRGQIAAAKMKLIILAKASLAQKIKQGDGPTIRWYLERKCPEEFGRQALEQEDTSYMPQYVVLPGGRHPRITPDPNDKRIVYADELEEHKRLHPPSPW